MVSRRRGYGIPMSVTAPAFARSCALSVDRLTTIVRPRCLAIAILLISLVNLSRAAAVRITAHL
jgi:hypothetical protein